MSSPKSRNAKNCRIELFYPPMNLGFHYHVIWRIDVFSKAKEISLTHKIKLFKFFHFTTLKLIIPCQFYFPNDAVIQ